MHERLVLATAPKFYVLIQKSVLLICAFSIKRLTTPNPSCLVGCESAKSELHNVYSVLRVFILKAYDIIRNYLLADDRRMTYKRHMVKYGLEWSGLDL